MRNSRRPAGIVTALPDEGLTTNRYPTTPPSGAFLGILNRAAKCPSPATPSSSAPVSDMRLDTGLEPMLTSW